MEKKIVLVTGVTGVIGKAVATEFAKNNCRLILLGRDLQKLSGVRSEIASRTGNNDLVAKTAPSPVGRAGIHRRRQERRSARRNRPPRTP